LRIVVRHITIPFDKFFPCCHSCNQVVENGRFTLRHAYPKAKLIGISIDKEITFPKIGRSYP
jgi:hypothetical protein